MPGLLKCNKLETAWVARQRVEVSSGILCSLEGKGGCPTLLPSLPAVSSPFSQLYYSKKESIKVHMCRRWECCKQEGKGQGHERRGGLIVGRQGQGDAHVKHISERSNESTKPESVLSPRGVVTQNGTMITANSMATFQGASGVSSIPKITRDTSVLREQCDPSAHLCFSAQLRSHPLLEQDHCSKVDLCSRAYVGCMWIY